MWGEEPPLHPTSATLVVDEGDRTIHQSVMTAEVMAHLRPASERVYVDSTGGAGGHAEAILQASGPDGRLLCLDRDPDAVACLTKRLQPFASRLTARPGNFADLAEFAADAGITSAHGILFDLGFSSDQVDAPERGFSFQSDGPLDMRYDRSGGPTAADIIARTPQTDLADILFEFGGERRSRRIAREIADRRRRQAFATTADLAGFVAGILGHRGRIHPATRTFQALRIYVNQELGNLSAGLSGALRLLAPGGRLVVISFHSLEDRIVKNFIRDHAREGRLEILTAKPLRPGADEVHINPRSRSARLRAAAVVA